MAGVSPAKLLRAGLWETVTGCHVKHKSMERLRKSGEAALFAFPKKADELNHFISSGTVHCFDLFNSQWRSWFPGGLLS